MIDLKELFKNDLRVTFVRYFEGALYYEIRIGLVTYQFPVPIADIGEATFLATDKASVFMRYVRKGIAEGTFIKTAEEFEYEIKCTECSRVYKIKRDRALTEEEIKKGGVCRNCEDDFK